MWVLMQSCNSKMQYLRGPNHAHAALVEVHQYYPGRATLLPGLQHWEHCTPVRTQGHTGSTAHPVLFPWSDSLVKTCGRRCLCWLAGGLCHAALSQVARQVSPGTVPAPAQLSLVLHQILCSSLTRYCVRYCASVSPGTAKRAQRHGCAESFGCQTRRAASRDACSGTRWQHQALRLG